ncbi:MAG: MgtC/SapB family protein [Candidatus Omnitrophica bacterium]|nr:MgtC/SapB family protein [Candidatus Omnitrophota bacterium]
MSSLELTLRLLLALLLGGAVGLEREKHGRAAGLRTHILVCMGSALMMCLSLFLYEKYESDPSRIASQVISGIGFLGAGTILRFRASVKGLTTAASLWAVSGIGLAAGAGFYFGSLVTTALVLGSLFWVAKMAEKLLTHRDWYRSLEIEMEGAFEGLQKIRDILTNYSTEIKDFDITKLETGNVRIVLDLRLLSPREEDPVLKEIAGLKGVERVVWREA